jgi:guanine deaminase
MNNKYMQLAIKEAQKGMNANEGGPFGAVIVRNDEVIGIAHNKVIISSDPTAHAEILAIRQASEKLGSFDLSDCDIYSTCEPCPMCLGAIYWARIKRLYFGCTRGDAAEIDFSDKHIYDAIEGKIEDNRVKSIQIERKSCLPLFEAWKKKPDKVQY